MKLLRKSILLRSEPGTMGRAMSLVRHRLCLQPHHTQNEGQSWQSIGHYIASAASATLTGIVNLSGIGRISQAWAQTGALKKESHQVSGQTKLRGGVS